MEEIEQACIESAQTRKDRTITIQELYTMRQLKNVEQPDQAMAAAGRERMNAPRASNQSLMIPLRTV
jgi:Spy/CpxP family protein refolding chaperone